MADWGVGSSLRRLCAPTGALVALGLVFAVSATAAPVAGSAARSAGPAEDAAGPADGDRRRPAGAGRDAGTRCPAPDARREGAGATREAEARPREGQAGREAEGVGAGSRGAAATRSLPGAAGRVRSSVPVRRLGRPRPARARRLRAAARRDGRRGRALRRAAAAERAARVSLRSAFSSWRSCCHSAVGTEPAIAAGPPIAHCSPGPEDCSGWYRADVTVTWTWDSGGSASRTACSRPSRPTRPGSLSECTVSYSGTPYTIGRVDQARRDASADDRRDAIAARRTQAVGTTTPLAVAFAGSRRDVGHRCRARVRRTAGRRCCSLRCRARARMWQATRALQSFGFKYDATPPAVTAVVGSQAGRQGLVPEAAHGQLRRHRRHLRDRRVHRPDPLRRPRSGQGGRRRRVPRRRRERGRGGPARSSTTRRRRSFPWRRPRSRRASRRSSGSARRMRCSSSSSARRA